MHERCIGKLTERTMNLRMGISKRLPILPCLSGEIRNDEEPFGEKMERLTVELAEQFDKSEELKEQIKKNFEVLGYGL